jgi:hypothetical protein
MQSPARISSSDCGSSLVFPFHRFCLSKPETAKEGSPIRKENCIASSFQYVQFNNMLPQSLSILFGLALGLAPLIGRGQTTVKTDDGLELTFTDAGKIKSASIDRQKLAALGTGGFLIRDASVKNADFAELPGSISSKNGVTVSTESEALQLALEAQFESKKDFIDVSGVVRNLSNDKERCVDLKFALPIDCRGWRWGTDAAGEDVIAEKIEGQKLGDITVYPVAPVSQAKSGAGVSLAIPPTHPTLFSAGADDKGLFLILKIGLSQATSPANETKFRFIIYRHDSEWGFRSSIQRYYGFFRDPFFMRRVKKLGAWGWHYPVPPSELPNADLYAFHEAAGELWKLTDEGKHGYEHEGELRESTRLAWQKDAQTGSGGSNAVADFERLAKLAGDEKVGIYSLPYTIVGQRQVYHLPAMPSNREEALAAFEKWTGEPMLIQGPPPAASFRSAAQLKEIIRNSGIYDEQQRPTVLMRQYLGNTLSFPQNPNPNLFSDTPQLTIAKYTLDEYLPMLFRNSKYIDGCYVDSLGRWPGYYNFRREHFKYSTVPLTYTRRTDVETETDEDAEGKIVKRKSERARHEMPPQPCLWNLQSHAEYLWELSRRLHAENKIVFANGIHANRIMLGFYVDALGMEGLPSMESRAAFYSLRVAAYNKPYCALNGRNSTNPKAWNAALFLGILIGARGEEGQKLERKYLPAIIKLNEAGWEPVTLARTDNPSVGLERWGGGYGSRLYFSMLNRSDKPVTAKIVVDAKALKISTKAKVLDLISQQVIEIQAKLENGFTIPLGPHEARAIGIISTP